MSISNNVQVSVSKVKVLNRPAVGIDDLVYTLGGTGLTQSGVNGNIYAGGIKFDLTTPNNQYFGGNKQISKDSIKFYGSKENLLISNDLLELVSVEHNKGLFEISYSFATDNCLIDKSVSDGSPTIISFDDDGILSYAYGDYLEVRESNDILAAGLYFVIGVDVVSSTKRVYIDYNSFSSITGSVSGVSIRVISYVWDEIYCTPVGLYLPSNVHTPDQLGYYEMQIGDGVSGFFGTDLHHLSFGIENAEQIIPKIGDTVCIKRFIGDINVYNNSSGTDEVNATKFFLGSDQELFQVLSVSYQTVSGRKVYTLVLDKPINLEESFTGSGIIEKYFIILLNREDSSVQEELLSDTFNLTEVHTKQLLGDPFKESDINLFVGATNHYNYKNSGRLGLKWQFKELLPEGDTPFIVLEIGDKIKDRISSIADSFELHLPGVMLQDNTVGCVLTNGSSNVVQNDNGIGSYCALVNKYNPTEQFGWLLFDWRVVLISDSELATALMYNSKRSYTLPTPICQFNENSREWPTRSNPLQIANIIRNNGNPFGTTKIVTQRPHGLKDLDFIALEGVIQPSELNNVTNTNPFQFYAYFVKVIDTYTLELWNDNLASFVPVNTDINFIGDDGKVQIGSGVIYQDFPSFRYFFTYRLKQNIYGEKATLPYSKEIPFNFVLNNNANNATGSLTVQIPSLTHLLEYDNVLSNPLVTKQGFNADEWELIIGEYEVDPNSRSKIIGKKNVVVMPTKNLTNDSTVLKDLGKQVNLHQVSYSKSDYDARVASGSWFYNLTDEFKTIDLPNNVGTSNELIYNLTSIPLDLFTGRNKWLLGNVIYKEAISQYRLSFDLFIPADKWNGTTNPSYDSKEQLIDDKLISEIAFLVEDANLTEGTNPLPYIYGKINPPIKKSNSADINVRVSIDF